MLFPTDEFNKEINALGRLKRESALQPLVKEQVRQRVLQGISGIERERPPVLGFLSGGWRKAVQFFVSLVSGLALVGGTVFASNGTVPGDLLYQVKRTREKVEVSLTAKSDAKAQLTARHAEERIRELEKIRGGQGDQKFENELKSEASLEVKNAVTVLSQVKADLEAKGNTTAANAVNQAISRLQQKAQSAKVEFEYKSEDGKTEVKIKTEGAENGRERQKVESEIRGSDGGTETRIKTEDGGTKVEIRQEDGRSEVRVENRVNTGESEQSEVRIRTESGGTSTEINSGSGITVQSQAQYQGSTSEYRSEYASSTQTVESGDDRN